MLAEVQHLSLSCPCWRKGVASTWTSLAADLPGHPAPRTLRAINISCIYIYMYTIYIYVCVHTNRSLTHAGGAVGTPRPPSKKKSWGAFIGARSFCAARPPETAQSLTQAGPLGRRGHPARKKHWGAFIGQRLFLCCAASRNRSLTHVGAAVGTPRAPSKKTTPGHVYFL